MRGHVAGLIICSLLAGCTSNLAGGLGTLKNPSQVLSGVGEEALPPIVLRNYRVLQRAAIPPDGSPVPRAMMKEYLEAGFALSNHYCFAFFYDADESQRRRKFGRAATNDLGTAFSTILGLASAGENVVTAAAASVGLADSFWRNYDEAFVVDPNLANVKALVMAERRNAAARALADDARLPTSYSGAHIVLLDYDQSCSTLGLRQLIDNSSIKQKSELDKQSAAIEKDGITAAAAAEPTPAPVPPAGSVTPR